MIKFIHRVIFTWIWVLTWAEVAITSLFILAGLGYGIILMIHPSIGPYLPFHNFAVLLGMLLWTAFCLGTGFIAWIGTTLHLIMLGYYTRPQAWPEHHDVSLGYIKEYSEPVTQFNKAIYSR